MTTNLPESTTLILSRDELLCVLSALEAETVPGIDSEPTGQRAEEESLLAQEVAIRSLRARGLARQVDGTTLFDNRLLDAVGTCVYPTSALTAFHWDSAESEPARFFGNVRGEICVVHTRPESLIHRFDMYTEQQQLAAALVQFYQLSAGSLEDDRSNKVAFTIDSEVFATIRQLGEQDNVQKAEQVLTDNQIDATSAGIFAHVFADAPKLTVLQTITETTENAMMKRDFMLAESGNHLWFVGAVGGNVENSALRIKSVTTDEVQALVTDWL